jgi:thioredoxin reductase (NADPH)
MIYDLIIIGAGPAGLAASIYASRYKIKHLLIGQLLGGLASQGHLIENYPGYGSLSGKELMEKFVDQVKGYGPEISEQPVIDVTQGEVFKVKTADEKIFEARALIIASGTERKKLEIPGEKEFWGKGVAYCATCDAPLYKNKAVVVVGGGDAALTAALLLSDYAKKVYLIHRRKEYSGQPTWQEKVLANDKIEKIFENNLKKIRGDQVVREIVLEKPWQNSDSLKTDGLFIEIGAVPVVALVEKMGVALDEKRYIKVDKDCQTNVSGVFAAGDVTNCTPLKQILTSASQGAIAAYSVYRYLSK